jgi:3-oxosteroid 1-dehydrogenase
MSSEEKEQKRISRREFVKGAAVGAAAGALAGCTPAATPEVITKEVVVEKEVPVTIEVEKQVIVEKEVPVEVIKEVEVKPWLPEKWDYEADVVVVGYGGAGSVTAITAHDAGVKVLMLEKQPADTPTKINQTNSTRTSASCTMHWLDKEEAIRFLKFCSRGATPDDVIEAWAEYAISTKDWLEGIGATLTGTDEPVASEFVDVFDMPGDNHFYRMFHEDMGPGLWRTLSSAVGDRGIDILFESPVKELIQDTETKEVLGVIAEKEGNRIYVKAKKAVVLTCGGFEYDFEALKTFVFGAPCRFYANPGNTGDGIKMAQAVGAALWHMPLIGGRVIPYFPELGHGCMGGTPTPFILVTKYGERFLRWRWRSHSACWEATKWDTDLCDFPASPCFSIFDQSAVARPVVTTGRLGPLALGNYAWSEDNSAEIAKGWILKGDTIEELAGVIAQDPDAAGKMKPEVLADTLRRYNEYCANGEDPEFGRDTDTLVPLETPPFYALKMYPGGVNTFGGPKRNAKGLVVNSFDEPIPRLFSGGELGSILGFLYPRGGWNICEVVVSGQIAGKNAAALEPWA